MKKSTQNNNQQQNKVHSSGPCHLWPLSPWVQHQYAVLMVSSSRNKVSLTVNRLSACWWSVVYNSDNRFIIFKQKCPKYEGFRCSNLSICCFSCLSSQTMWDLWVDCFFSLFRFFRAKQLTEKILGINWWWK